MSSAVTVEVLLPVILNASSGNYALVQETATQLSNFEKQPGYYSSLQSIYIDPDRHLPVVARHLAIIQLKNGIDKYWRKTALNAMSKEEKALIGSRCIDSGVNEADPQLAVINAVATAKIIRHEYPHDWPNALTSLTELLRLESGSGLRLPRVLLLLHYAVKELSTARLMRSVASFRTATPEIFRSLAPAYAQLFQKWLNFLQHEGGDDEGGVVDSIDHSLKALKILRRLMVHGYDHPNRAPEAREFWSLIHQQFRELFGLLIQGNGAKTRRVSSTPSTLAKIEAHLVQMAKLHLSMVQIRPEAFPLLPDSIELAKAYWQLITEFGKNFGIEDLKAAQIGADGDAEDEEPSYLERLALKGLLILRACAKMVYNPAHTFKYQHAEDKEERKSSRESMKTNMLSTEMVREIMETLVAKFFVFRPQDLRQWQTEPDEWERREEGDDAWNFSVRVCAEKLFLDLVIHNKDLLIEPLLNVFYSIASTYYTDILRKDSIYAAIGLAAPVLNEHLDFDAFLKATLVPEVQIRNPGYFVLRRRISILLGQWAPIKPFDKHLTFQIFDFLLSKEDELNDQVVRVTAGRQLHGVVDPYEFHVQAFLPFAPSILARLMALIQETELAETKLALLTTLSSIVVRMESNVVPYADQIISLLPPLWEQATDWLMKQSILGVLTALVTSLGARSSQYQRLLIPLVQNAVDPDSEMREYLLEDGLELWEVLIEHGEVSEELFALSRFLFPMFDTASDTLKQALEVTEQYLLLSPSSMLADARQYIDAFTRLLSGGLKREASCSVTHLIEVFVRSAQPPGPAFQSLASVLVQSDFFTYLLSALETAHEAHQTTGPNRTRTTIDGIVETDHFNVLAHIVYADTPLSIKMLEMSTGAVPEAMSWLLAEWFSHLGNVGDPCKKKMMCLALTSMLQISPPQVWILSRLQDLMAVWTEVVVECVEYTDDFPAPQGRDTLLYRDPDALRLEDRYESPEQRAKRLYTYHDPVHQVSIKDFVAARLQGAIEACGGQEVFRGEWLVNVDADVVKSFEQAMAGENS